VTGFGQAFRQRYTLPTDVTQARETRRVWCAAFDAFERPAICVSIEEVQNMKRVLILGGFLLGTAFFAQVAMADDHHDKKYYDRQGRDYHVYNKQEDRAYRAYLEQQHQSYREFNKTKRNQQEQYFKWRHEHPDNTLFKVEVR
jgi:hypothetical protein